MEMLRSSLSRRISSARSQPNSRTAITEIIAISSKSSRPLRHSKAAQDRIENARSNLETMLFRLEQHPFEQDRLAALMFWESRLPPEAHPFVKSIFHGVYADTLARLYRVSTDPDWARRALSNYELAQLNFFRSGLIDQFRSIRDGCRRILDDVEEPFLPGLERSEPSHPTPIGFSVERLCGFSIQLDDVPMPAQRNLSAKVATATYRFYGEVKLTDRELTAALTGLHSPSRRLAASVFRNGNQVTVTTGVRDELRALLCVDDPIAPYNDVQAIRVSSDTISFIEPWFIRPTGTVKFSGRATGRAPLKVSVRATMTDGLDLLLSIDLDAKKLAVEHYV
jgi:hypothetical protein